MLLQTISRESQQGVSASRNSCNFFPCRLQALVGDTDQLCPSKRNVGKRGELSFKTTSGSDAWRWLQQDSVSTDAQNPLPNVGYRLIPYKDLVGQVVLSEMGLSECVLVHLGALYLFG